MSYPAFMCVVRIRTGCRYVWAGEIPCQAATGSESASRLNVVAKGEVVAGSQVKRVRRQRHVTVPVLVLDAVAELLIVDQLSTCTTVVAHDVTRGLSVVGYTTCRGKKV